MKKIVALLPIFLCLAFFMVGCGSSATRTSTPAAPAATSAASAQGDQAMAFELSSTAFAPGESIPVKFTCDGDDTSPPLQWSDPPQGTQSFALIVDDPDAPAGTWVHWVLYNLPAESRSLPGDVPPDSVLTDGSRHGQNNWRRLGYGGPCPPSGTHRYFFKLYALDKAPDLEAGATKDELLKAMEGHIVDQTEVMGVYSRQ
jgi:Raf kinase inhibitor-like YbhB/YbcL family protein